MEFQIKQNVIQFAVLEIHLKNPKTKTRFKFNIENFKKIHILLELKYFQNFWKMQFAIIRTLIFDDEFNKYRLL